LSVIVIFWTGCAYILLIMPTPKKMIELAIIVAEISIRFL
jgi:hypothetical protein